MRALETALIYFVPFMAIGLIARFFSPRWMARHGAEPSDMDPQAAAKRWRRVFPVGMSRREE
jgi:hypothetical protein